MQTFQVAMDDWSAARRVRYRRISEFVELSWAGVGSLTLASSAVRALCEDFTKFHAPLPVFMPPPSRLPWP
jgi:hypothetical protein